MRKRHRKRSLLVTVALLLLALSLSGCVYLRLLYFKNQLKSFDENVSIVSSSSLTLKFRNPVVKDSDFTFITGSSPGKIQAVSGYPEKEIWTWKFEKKKSEPSDEDYAINFDTEFTGGLLTQMKIDESFIQLFGEDLILHMLRSMGTAKINKIRRSMSTELEANSLGPDPLPSFNQITNEMGRPTKINQSRSDSTTKAEYEFNFYNPENGKKAGQFRLFFMSNSQHPDSPITGFRVTGNAR